MTKRSYVEAVLLGFEQYHKQKHHDDSGMLVKCCLAHVLVHPVKARLGRGGPPATGRVLRSAQPALSAQPAYTRQKRLG